MNWIKRDTDFMSRFIHLFIHWPITFPPRSLVCIFCHHRPPYVRPTTRTSDVGHQTNVSKGQGQPSISLKDIVEVDQLRNLSGGRLRPDQPTTSLGEKGLELTCYRPMLPFSSLQSLFYLYTAEHNFGDHLILKNYKSCTDMFPALT